MEIRVLFSFSCGNLSHIRHSRAQLYPTAQPECIDGNAIKLWFLRDCTQKKFSPSCTRLCGVGALDNPNSLSFSKPQTHAFGSIRNFRILWIGNSFHAKEIAWVFQKQFCRSKFLCLPPCIFWLCLYQQKAFLHWIVQKIPCLEKNMAVTKQTAAISNQVWKVLDRKALD